MIRAICIAFLLAFLANVARAQESQAEPRFSEDSFRIWLAAAPERAQTFAEFETFLAERNVSGIAPNFQLWRTSSSSAQCNRDAFAAPERAYWSNIVRTLEFIRDHVEPAIGEVEVASGYRDEALNACSRGRPQGAHRRYYALDLWPADPAITRETLIDRLCALYGTVGAAYRLGLGFYARTRFHVDSMRHRRWGPDGSGATSPCNGR